MEAKTWDSMNKTWKQIYTIEFPVDNKVGENSGITRGKLMVLTKISVNQTTAEEEADRKEDLGLFVLKCFPPEI